MLCAFLTAESRLAVELDHKLVGITGVCELDLKHDEIIIVAVAVKVEDMAPMVIEPSPHFAHSFGEIGTVQPTCHGLHRRLL
jgi:hypothetical protein